MAICILANLTYYFVWFVYWQAMFGAKDPSTVRKGFGYGQAFFGFCVWLMIPIGMSIAILMPDIAPFEAGPLFINAIPGFLGAGGLIIAAVIFVAQIAAGQSSVTACTLAPVTQISHDILKKKFNIHDDKTLLKYSRMMIIFVIIAGVALGYSGQGVLDLLLLGNLVVGASLFCPLMFGLFAKKINVTAALLSSIAVPILTLGIYLYGFYVLGNIGYIGNGWHAVTIGLATSFVIMVVGTIFGKDPNTIESASKNAAENTAS